MEAVRGMRAKAYEGGLRGAGFCIRKLCKTRGCSNRVRRRGARFWSWSGLCSRDGVWDSSLLAGRSRDYTPLFTAMNPASLTDAVAEFVQKRLLALSEFFGGFHFNHRRFVRRTLAMAACRSAFVSPAALAAFRLSLRRVESVSIGGFLSFCGFIADNWFMYCR